jgi:hypothetical protein
MIAFSEYSQFKVLFGAILWRVPHAPVLHVGFLKLFVTIQVE